MEANNSKYSDTPAPPELGTVAYKSGTTLHSGTVHSDGIKILCQHCQQLGLGHSFATFSSVDAWINHVDPPKQQFQNPDCVLGCGFTASWGLSGGVPGCQNNQGSPPEYCFSCFKQQHTPAQVAEAQLRTDIHLSSGLGPENCNACYVVQEGKGTAQHFADSTGRSKAWRPATCCLEHLLGYNPAHNKEGGNVKGTYTACVSLLEEDHPLMVEAKNLIQKLRMSQLKNYELD